MLAGMDVATCWLDASNLCGRRLPEPGTETSTKDPKFHEEFFLGSLSPNFLYVFLRKSLLCKDFLLICTAYRSHVMVFRKFLSCKELCDSPCTQKTVGESGCSIDVSHCFEITCN